MDVKDVFADGLTGQPPSGAPMEATPSLTPSWLVSAIQNEIVPRLLLAQRQAMPVAAKGTSVAPCRDDIETLALLAIRDTHPATAQFVDDLRLRGMTAEVMIADLLPGAARYLGWMWETDACTFVEVTYGLSRLQQMLHRCAPQLRVGQDRFGAGRRALLTTMPGEQHSFGLCVVEEWFRNAGWTVETERPKTATDLSRAVHVRGFDVVGLSISADRSAGQINSLIRTLRRNACNPHMKVVVGGCVIARRPDIARSVSADIVASEGLDGLNRLAKLMHAPFVQA